MSCGVLCGHAASAAAARGEDHKFQASPQASGPGAGAEPTERSGLVMSMKEKAVAGEGMIKGTYEQLFKELRDRHVRARIIYLVLILGWTIMNSFIFMHALERVDGNLDVCQSDRADDPDCPPVTWLMGLYFTVVTGLCVGFGTLTEKPGWRYYTLVNTLVWLVFIAFFIGLVVSMAQIKRLLAIDETVRDRAHRFKRYWLISAPGLLLAAWIAMGTIFQMNSCGWDFETAFYFSFMAMSTTGQIGPCSMGTVELVFVILYLLTGVPLFGMPPPLTSLPPPPLPPRI